MKITQVPLIYGNKEQLTKFMEEVVKFGYEYSNTLRDFSMGMLKLNGNSTYSLRNDISSFKRVVGTSPSDSYGYLTGSMSTVKFILPKDYNASIQFMRENMRIFNKEIIEYEIY